MCIVVVTVLAGCARDQPSLEDLDADPSIASPSTSQDGTATTTTSAKDKADSDKRVLADYRAFWDDVAAAFNAGASGSARLEDHATGQALFQLQQRLRSASGADRPPRLLDPEVETRGGGLAAVTDCVDLSGWPSLAATFSPRSREAGKTQRFRALAGLRLFKDTWKVSSIYLYQEERTCGG
jgi:hypothetical protein